MKKQKIKILNLLFLVLIVMIIESRSALANGNATISWVAPTTNEDGSDLSDLSGYRIFYSTNPIDCTDWDNASDQAARQATSLFSVSHVDVSEAAALRHSSDPTKRGYTFSTRNLLTPGQTYYFTVVAYDNASTPNFSKCVNDSGSNKTGSKLVRRSGDINSSGGVVDISDLSVLAGDYGKTSWCRIASHIADINGDCVVGISDLSILAADYGLN